MVIINGHVGLFWKQQNAEIVDHLDNLLDDENRTKSQT